METELELHPLETAAPTASIALAEQAAGDLSLETFDLKKLALSYFGPWRADVAAVNAKFAGLMLDLPNASKIADGKSLVHRLVGKPVAAARATTEALKKKLNGAKDDVVAELTAIVADYEAAAKPIRAQIEAAEARITEEKRIAAEKEAARIQAHTDNLAKLAGYVEHARGLPAARIQMGIELVEKIAIDAVAWQDFADRAEEQKAVTLERMRALHAQAVAAEAEAVRLAAEKAETERKAAELKAEADRLAAERAEIERQKADLQAEKDRIAAETQAERDRIAAEERIYQTRIEAEARVAADLLEVALKQRDKLNSEAQDSQQVLKAEPATADATDRDAPVITSPSVGSMGAGQAADAAPSVAPAPEVRAFHPAAAALRGEVLMLKLGELWDILGLSDREAFLESVGFPATPAPKGTGKLYRQCDLQSMCLAIAERFTALAGQQKAA